MKTVCSIVLAAILATNAVAAESGSWQSLAGLAPAQKIEVATKRDTVKGEFVRFDDQGVTLRDKRGEHTVPQADVNRVTLPKGKRGIWIGAAVGAGGGAAAGAALGSRLANESGGDFDGLKPLIAGACAGAGALIGVLIGTAARRTHTIYQKP